MSVSMALSPCRAAVSVAALLLEESLQDCRGTKGQTEAPEVAPPPFFSFFETVS